MPGKVYLVGAGPGDPGLITVRGRELLERADVIVYDSLVDETLLRFAPHAEAVYAGKRAGLHSFTQDDINRLLIEHAGKGARVVRLKGGDPFVFGRGGEELLALEEAGIAYEVVPGVSAATAAAAYAGIPVTHRGVSSRVTMLSAHDVDRWTLSHDTCAGTLVVFMGAKRIAEIVEKLVECGWSKTTPAAAIAFASWPQQQTVVAPLSELHSECNKKGLSSPATIVIGEVVPLHERLRWFEQRPLFGKRVAITRTRSGAGELIALLQQAGAEIFDFESVRFESPEPMPGRVHDYDWIVLASPNAVASLMNQLHADSGDARALHGVRLLTVGAKSAKALQEFHLRADAASESYEPKHVADALRDAAHELNGLRILVPRADVARRALAETLREAGAHVTEWQSFRAAIPADAEGLAERLVRFAPDYVTFMGTAAPRNFARILGGERLAQLRDTTIYAAIGPRTATAATEAGLPVTLTAATPTTEALVDALIAHAARTD